MSKLKVRKTLVRRFIELDTGDMFFKKSITLQSALYIITLYSRIKKSQCPHIQRLKINE